MIKNHGTLEHTSLKRMPSSAARLNAHSSPLPADPNVPRLRCPHGRRPRSIDRHRLPHSRRVAPALHEATPVVLLGVERVVGPTAKLDVVDLVPATFGEGDDRVPVARHSPWLGNPRATKASAPRRSGPAMPSHRNLAPPRTRSVQGQRMSDRLRSTMRTYVLPTYPFDDPRPKRIRCTVPGSRPMERRGSRGQWAKRVERGLKAPPGSR